jgi:hypothetical protein
MLYALLLSGSALLADWLGYWQIGWNPNDSRAALQRWSDWLNNERIEVNNFYRRLLAKALQAFAGQRVYLSLDAHTTRRWSYLKLCLSWLKAVIQLLFMSFLHQQA